MADLNSTLIHGNLRVTEDTNLTGQLTVNGSKVAFPSSVTFTGIASNGFVKYNSTGAITIDSTTYATIGALVDYVPLSGTALLGGAVIPSTNEAVDLGSWNATAANIRQYRSVYAKNIYLNGSALGTAATYSSATFAPSSHDHSYLIANYSTSYISMILEGHGSNPGYIFYADNTGTALGTFDNNVMIDMDNVSSIMRLDATTGIDLRASDISLSAGSSITLSTGAGIYAKGSIYAVPVTEKAGYTTSHYGNLGATDGPFEYGYIARTVYIGSLKNYIPSATNPNASIWDGYNNITVSNYLEYNPLSYNSAETTLVTRMAFASAGSYRQVLTLRATSNNSSAGGSQPGIYLSGTNISLYGYSSIYLTANNVISLVTSTSINFNASQGAYIWGKPVVNGWVHNIFCSYPVPFTCQIIALTSSSFTNCASLVNWLSSNGHTSAGKLFPATGRNYDETVVGVFANGAYLALVAINLSNTWNESAMLSAPVSLFDYVH